MRRFLVPALTLLVIVPLARAQHGDKADEVQHPPPASLVIPPAPMLSAEEEMKTFTLAPGFRVELVAADPIVGDPVAMAFGPDGRIWVVEMRGFMPDADGTNERAPVCDIAVLEDTHGDGRMDKRTVFLDHLILPRAVALVDGGVLVAEPAHLWFCRDTKGTGVCDQKTEIASDYGNTNNPEHNANGLMWAMDNWIYSANLTTRFRYEGGGKFRREATITRGQWGITQDNFGRVYYNSNSDPLRVDELPAAYLKRNPNFAATGAAVQLVPALLPVYPNRVTPGINRGYKTLDRAGKMYFVTAACGPVIYRGALFPARYQGTAFIAEPAGNLIKQIDLTEEKGALRGANAYKGTEFFMSTDERFRPVNLSNGPDGAMYVVDMYRGIIQHRIYLTTYLRQQALSRNLDKNDHYGRIYRVVPEDAPPARERMAKVRNLALASPADLVAALNDPNGWTRDTAQRLLVEKHDAGIAPTVRQLAVDPSATPLGRLHALWTLEGLDAIDPPTLLTALGDPDPHVCAAAIRLSEKWLSAPGDSGIFERVRALTDNPDPAVRLQLALSLGEARTPAGDEALCHLVERAGRQPFLADAAVSGLSGREADFVERAVRAGSAGAPASLAVSYATGAVLKLGDAHAIDRVLALAGEDSSQDWARSAVVAGVRYFLPKSAEGKMFPGNLPAEPKALVALAGHRETALGQSASVLLAKLRWPGKPGLAAEAVAPLAPAEQALFDKGKLQFATLCAACHQPNGQGLAGLAPPLIYSRWVLGDTRVLARIVLSGKATENLAMPPWRTVLDDNAIAAVLTFIRRSWGHEASAVTPEVVAAARKATADRTEPWSDADLEDLLQDLTPVKTAATQ